MTISEVNSNDYTNFIGDETSNGLPVQNERVNGHNSHVTLTNQILNPTYSLHGSDGTYPTPLEMSPRYEGTEGLHSTSPQERLDDTLLHQETRDGLLREAAKIGKFEEVKILLENGANINTPDIYRFTPLHYAYLGGHKDVVELLLQKGANINIPDASGRTPLHYACLGGDKDVVELLLQKGANINIPDASGRTPLHRACNHGHKDVVELLLQKGADINKPGANGVTPLHWACYLGIKCIVELLLQKGADINKPGANGVTPLHLACYRGHKDVVELLLQKGADINKPAASGFTPLHRACYRGHKDVVEFLLQKGADINKPNTFGATPIHSACSNGHKDVVELLLQKGADTNKPDANGRTPLETARYRRHKDVVELMLQWLGSSSSNQLSQVSDRSSTIVGQQRNTEFKEVMAQPPIDETVQEYHLGNLRTELNVSPRGTSVPQRLQLAGQRASNFSSNGKVVMDAEGGERLPLFGNKYYPDMPDPLQVTGVRGNSKESELSHHSSLMLKLLPSHSAGFPLAYMSEEVKVELGDFTLEGSYLSLKHTSDCERYTFVRAGRVHNDTCHIPEEKSGGKVVLLLHSSDLPEGANAGIYVNAFQDVLLIEAVSGFDLNDKCTSYARRLAALAFAIKKDIKDCLLLDDNIESYHAQEALIGPNPSWEDIYQLFRTASKNTNLPIIGVSSYDPVHKKKGELISSQVETEQKFAGKSSYFNVQAIRNFLNEKNRDLAHFALPNENCCGEDMFFALLVGSGFGRISRKTMVIQRSSKGQSLSRARGISGERWLGLNISEDFDNKPDYWLEAVHMMVNHAKKSKQHHWKNWDELTLEKCLSIQSRNDLFTVERAFDSEEVMEQKEALRLADSKQKGKRPALNELEVSATPPDEITPINIAMAAEQALHEDEHLRDVQKEALRSIHNTYNECPKSSSPTALIKMITGSGKTRLFSQLMTKLLPFLKKGQHILVLSPRQVITHQNRVAVQGQGRNHVLEVHAEATNSKILNCNKLEQEEPTIFSACNDSFVNALQEDTDILSHFQLIIGDEEHLLSNDLFTLIVQSQRPFIGFSATPREGRKYPLGTIYECGLERGMEDKIICPLAALSVEKKEEASRVQCVVDFLLNTTIPVKDEPNIPLLNKPGLIVAKSIEEANELANEIAEHGRNQISVKAYHSNLDKNQKDEILSNFNENRINCLCVVKTLQEGYDNRKLGWTLFVDPDNANNPNELAQRAGRVRRIDPDDSNKVGIIAFLGKQTLPSGILCEEDAIHKIDVQQLSSCVVKQIGVTNLNKNEQRNIHQLDYGHTEVNEPLKVGKGSNISTETRILGNKRRWDEVLNSQGESQEPPQKRQKASQHEVQRVNGRINIQKMDKDDLKESLLKVLPLPRLSEKDAMILAAALIKAPDPLRKMLLFVRDRLKENKLINVVRNLNSIESLINHSHSSVKLFGKRLKELSKLTEKGAPNTLFYQKNIDNNSTIELMGDERLSLVIGRPIARLLFDNDHYDLIIPVKRCS